MNTDSSRSHSVFILEVEQRDVTSGVRKCGRLYMVDLAGSERVDRTGASGNVLAEAKDINKSLSGRYVHVGVCVIIDIVCDFEFLMICCCCFF